MLMALAKKEYPVDTNVARVCARLGWVPLQVQIRVGNSYRCGLYIQ